MGSRIRRAALRPSWTTILASVLVAALALVPVVAFAFAPDPPTSLNAVPGAQPVIARLTWNPSSGAVRYAVSVATTASGPFRMVGETQVTSYDFKDGLGGVPYYFRVAALNEQGEQSSPAPQPTGPVTSAWVSDPHAPATSRTSKCASCHVPHQALASPLMRTEVATDTPGQSATCLTCHDGKIASAGNVASGAKDSFALASGHSLDTSASAGGLTEQVLQLPRSSRHGEQEGRCFRRRRSTVRRLSSNGNAWCLACHDDANSWYGSNYPPSSAPQTDSAGYPVAGTWLGAGTYNGVTNAHRLIPETTRTAGSGQDGSPRPGRLPLLPRCSSRCQRLRRAQGVLPADHRRHARYGPDPGHLRLDVLHLSRRRQAQRVRDGARRHSELRDEYGAVLGPSRQDRRRPAAGRRTASVLRVPQPARLEARQRLDDLRRAGRQPDDHRQCRCGPAVLLHLPHDSCHGSGCTEGLGQRLRHVHRRRRPGTRSWDSRGPAAC